MKFKYKYIAWKRRDGEVSMPMIPICLRGENGHKTFRTFALLDSGADMTCINKSIAETIELDLTREAEEMGGIGENTTIFLQSA